MLAGLLLTPPHSAVSLSLLAAESLCLSHLGVAFQISLVLPVPADERRHGARAAMALLCQSRHLWILFRSKPRSGCAKRVSPLSHSPSRQRPCPVSSVSVAVVLPTGGANELHWVGGLLSSFCTRWPDVDRRVMWPAEVQGRASSLLPILLTSFSGFHRWTIPLVSQHPGSTLLVWSSWAPFLCWTSFWVFWVGKRHVTSRAVALSGRVLWLQCFPSMVPPAVLSTKNRCK